MTGVQTCALPIYRILRAHLPAWLRLSDPERRTLAEIAKRVGRKALEKVARVAQLDTLLAWYRGLIARKFDGSGSIAKIGLDLRRAGVGGDSIRG